MVRLHKPVRVSNPWQLVQNSRAGPANLKGDERGTWPSYRENRVCVPEQCKTRFILRFKSGFLMG